MLRFKFIFKPFRVSFSSPRIESITMGLGGREPKSKNEIEFPSPQWIELPGDVTANILHRLGAVEILQSAQKVCTTWWRVCQDPAMWRVIHITHDGDDRYGQIPAMCRRVLDLSQGQLLDLTIKGFWNVELPNYVLDRSNHLKRLTLQDSDTIRPKGLVEAVIKLPHLEELHLISMPLLRAADIINIGISCSMLKSFSYSSEQPDVDYYSICSILDVTFPKLPSSYIPFKHLKITLNDIIFTH
ncbi:hypothetical protein ACS0TY_036258 [Phlomoides rotata]